MKGYQWIDDDSGKIILIKKNGSQVGFLQYAGTQVSGKHFLEIQQIYIAEELRGLGLGTNLILKVIRKSIQSNTGIHMQIQPGSENFYKKFFDQYFYCKQLSLFKATASRSSALNQNIKDGAILNITANELVNNYKFPHGIGIRDKSLDSVVKKYSI